MLLPIKPICQRKDSRKNGTSIIFIQYCFSSGQRTNLNTNIAIPPEHWNGRKHCISQTMPKQFGDYYYLNNEVQRMTRVVEDLAILANKKAVKNKGAFVKKLFSTDAQPGQLKADVDEVIKTLESVTYNNDNLDFFYQIDSYIECKRRKVSKGMLNVYRLMKERLKAYEYFSTKPISFNMIDFNFYESLIQFLTYDYIHRRRKETVIGLKVNTIGQTIKQFRIFINDRVKRKIIPQVDLTDFKIVDEEADTIYLSLEEVEKIYRVDLSDFSFLIEYRDLFVLACLTGLRFSDFSRLKKEDFRQGMLFKKQEKSEHWVVVPLRKEAQTLFAKQFDQSVPDVSNAEFNRHIKTVGKLAGLNEIITFSFKKGNKTVTTRKPKYEWITTHTGRRSFCTNEFLAGTPAKLIMKISGHKNEKDFYRYIRITPEEAAQKIKELWLDRNEMSVFKETESYKISKTNLAAKDNI